MSFNSTVDSLDGLATSQHSSQAGSQQVFVTTNRVKSQHLTHSQIIGVKQIFAHYFPKTPGKRMNKDEKKRKWYSYKNRIYREYGRIITGKFSSEKALIKRYSDPLRFVFFFLIN